MSETNRPAATPLDDVATIGRIDVVSNILEVVCRTTGLGFAAIARVTEDQWIACAVRDEIAFGLKVGGELRVATTICNEIRQSGQVVVIDHASADVVFCHHPTPKMYGFESYISVPIRRRDGRFFGTLCALDPKPARLGKPEVVGMFELFADLIALHLDAQQRLDASEAALAVERRRLELQDQLLAVLGHDLRSPLAAILTGAKLLPVAGSDEQRRHFATVIGRSAGRMTGLIDDILDFARARLGGSLPIAKQRQVNVGAMLEQVIAEAKTSHPTRTIHVEAGTVGPIDGDGRRIGQLLSNLLANALRHGDPAGPVWVRAFTTDEVFELSVANLGEPIPEDIHAKLFQPFARSVDRTGERGGLGLGSYIAAEIAHAHGGSLTVRSSPEETRFTFRMPRWLGP